MTDVVMLRYAHSDPEPFLIELGRPSSSGPYHDERWSGDAGEKQRWEAYKQWATESYVLQEHDRVVRLGRLREELVVEQMSSSPSEIEIDWRIIS